jgi:hypothetical protein
MTPLAKIARVGASLQRVDIAMFCRVKIGLAALSILLSFGAGGLVTTRAGAQTAEASKRDSMFTRQFGIWTRARLGDSSQAATLDSAARVAIYAAALEAARRGGHYGPERGRAWLRPDLLANDQPPMWGMTFDTLAPPDLGLLHAIVARAGMGLCKHAVPECPATRVGEASYAVSRIYRVDSTAVRVFIVTRASDPRVMGALTREDVYRLELRNGTWAVTAHSPVWIAD